MLSCRHRRESPEFWDKLSKIWLTKEALRELQRRTGRVQESPPKKPFQSASAFLRACSPSCLREIQKLSRHGGPDTTDLRDFPEPRDCIGCSVRATVSYSESFTESNDDTEEVSEGRFEDVSQRSSRDSSLCGSEDGSEDGSDILTKWQRFQQRLISYGIYPDGYDYPDGRVPGLPGNWDEVKERLTQPSASPLPIESSSEGFQQFIQAHEHARKQELRSGVIPTIHGAPKLLRCHGGPGELFNNLVPINDARLPWAKPEYYYGACYEQLDFGISRELIDLIIPSSEGEGLPIIAPNFFLELHGLGSTPEVVTMRAYYHGAIGARGIHALQSYGQEESVFDNKAYTITSTYGQGTLTLYTAHPIKPKGAGCFPQYITTKLGQWKMISNIETFIQGITAYRNAWDWAMEQRNEIIRLTNERRPQPKPQPSSDGDYADYASLDLGVFSDSNASWPTVNSFC